MAWRKKDFLTAATGVSWPAWTWTSRWLFTRSFMSCLSTDLE